MDFFIFLKIILYLEMTDSQKTSILSDLYFEGNGYWVRNGKFEKCRMKSHMHKNATLERI